MLATRSFPVLSELGDGNMSSPVLSELSDGNRSFPVLSELEDSIVLINTVTSTFRPNNSLYHHVRLRWKKSIKHWGHATITVYMLRPIREIAQFMN